MMKKNDCSVVRDLMPLVVDRAASDESREMVEQHIAFCEACRKQYDDMKAELPEGARQTFEEEQLQLMSALKAVRKTRLKRRLIVLVLAVVFCACAAFGGMFVYDRLYWQPSVMVDNSLYTLSVAKLKDGRLVMSHHTNGVPYESSYSTSRYAEDGVRVVYECLQTTPLSAAKDAQNADDWWFSFVILGDIRDDDILEIRQGKPEDYVTIIKAGEEIPAASEEMENYFQLVDEWNHWYSAQGSSHDGKSYANQEESRAWYDRLEAARKAVPEW